MKIYNKQVVFQEVPDEVSLAFSVAGCPLNCQGCSWSNFDKKNTKLLDLKTFENMLKKYKDYCTCVLFLGGEWNNNLIEYINVVKSYKLKTCLYTGLKLKKLPAKLVLKLDYLKTGSYVKNLGGLESPTTNQRFFDIKNHKILNSKFRRNIRV